MTNKNIANKVVKGTKSLVKHRSTAAKSLPLAIFSMSPKVRKVTLLVVATAVIGTVIGLLLSSRDR